AACQGIRRVPSGGIGECRTSKLNSRVKRSLTAVATDPWFGVANAGVLAKDYLPENYQPYVQTLNVAALGACAIKFVYKELSVGKSVPDNFKHFAYLSSMRRELL
ncbi:hypothetical protein, partial [Aeromonas veronii]|uniref:hypothetical protein n=1 Tax=Aeromonas veronii TaxID=654 RepID=UPI001FCFB3E5